MWSAPAEVAPEVATAQIPAAEEEQVIVALKLKHVAPSTMARWLLPAPSADNSKAGVAPLSSQTLAESILPHKEGREIWARTTPGRVQKLREIVEALDALQEKVQIEVQAARILRSDLVRLAAPVLDTSDAPAPRISSSFVKDSGYKPRLQSLLDARSAAFVLHQTVEATTGTPFALDSEAQPEDENSLWTSIKPTISDEGNVMLEIQVQGGAQKKRTAKSRFDRLVSMRDHDTIALILNDADLNSPRATIVFLSARLPDPTILNAPAAKK